jgi:hypothetical protein
MACLLTTWGDVLWLCGIWLALAFAAATIYINIQVTRDIRAERRRRAGK